MSLTSYRAAPPRGKTKRRIESSEWKTVSPLAIRRFKHRFEEYSLVLRRPGDDLLSQVLRHSTIGAVAFDGRVRDGIGSDHYAESHQAGEGQEIEANWVSYRTMKEHGH